ncbi:SoxR reducing system RseC family protein [uncultured Peptoniphilus sp.]|uniref:SoxR reducing system RseC family protein n=1 Tax=uncultured Peptoniphilus sp. TaxID=254354 RepID=UPI0028062445|nr:SoxR reducing system RseC family protein [uncultured Peptoniphilus sp.]
MEKLGIVKEVIGNKLYVEFTRDSACGESCATCTAKCAESKTEVLEIDNLINAKKGEVVEIISKPQNILSYFLLVYGLPLLLMLLAISLSYYFLSKTNLKNFEVLSFFIGFGSLIPSYLIIRFIDRKNAKAKDSYITLKRL